MTTQRFVRTARDADTDVIVTIQVAAWQATYGTVLPEPVLTELAGDEAAEQFRRQWQASIASPPTSKHRLLVATDDRAVVGFAALGPAEDPDRWPGTDAEIYALHVAPEHTRQGHGSRLLNAAVDHLVDDAFTAVYVWTLEADNMLRQFVEASGWRADGARRELDMGAPVPMIRLHAAISQ